MEFLIRKGLDIGLEGKPKPEVEATDIRGPIVIQPQEFTRIKHRLKVSEGDKIARGNPLFQDKRRPTFTFGAPCSGTVKSIVLGPQRVLERISIEPSSEGETPSSPTLSPEQVLTISREDILDRLLHSGLFALVRQRPFDIPANPDTRPSSIFVNGMQTAPFQADIHVAIRGQEADFQAGLNAITRLTNGAVHLCLGDPPAHASPAVTGAQHVTLHRFRGPHPAGNTSVHIDRVAPLQKGETIWTIRAVDLLLIGEWLTGGKQPSHRTIALGGPWVKEEARKYYRVPIGASLAQFLKNKLKDGEYRIVGGDALTGTQLDPDGYLRFFDSSIVVLPEGRQRNFMGWLMPSLNLFSRSRTFLSGWSPTKRAWALDTNQHGECRPMMLTGLYDRYLPLNILTDFLVRAALAHDTEEAVKLGILDTSPEDFALCSFVCPSKTNISTIIRSALDEIEKEGLA